MVLFTEWSVAADSVGHSDGWPVRHTYTLPGFSASQTFPHLHARLWSSKYRGRSSLSPLPSLYSFRRFSWLALEFSVAVLVLQTNFQCCGHFQLVCLCLSFRSFHLYCWPLNRDCCWPLNREQWPLLTSGQATVTVVDLWTGNNDCCWPLNREQRLLTSEQGTATALAIAASLRFSWPMAVNEE